MIKAKFPLEGLAEVNVGQNFGVHSVNRQTGEVELGEFWQHPDRKEFWIDQAFKMAIDKGWSQGEMERALENAFRRIAALEITMEQWKKNDIRES